MPYRNSFLLGAILGIALTACHQNNTPQKGVAQDTPKDIDQSTTLAAMIAQQKQQLQQAKLDLTQVRTRLTNLSQHHNNIQNDTTNRTSEVGANAQYVPTETPEEEIYESNPRRVSDNTSIQLSLGALVESPRMSEALEERSTSDFSLSLEEYFEKADQRLTTSFEEFLEEASDSGYKHWQHSTAETPALETAQPYNSSKREQGIVAIQSSPAILPEATLAEDPLQLPNTVSIPDGILPQYSDHTLLSARDMTALQANADSLDKHITQLEQGIEALEARLYKK